MFNIIETTKEYKRLGSILDKELFENETEKYIDEHKSTELWEKRFEEIEQHVAQKRPTPNKIKAALLEVQKTDTLSSESSEEFEQAMSNLVKQVSNKFDEYIIDEDEIYDILTAVDLMMKRKILYVDDKLDIWLKYIKLYFKQSNKQESIGTHEQDSNHIDKGDLVQSEYLKAFERLDSCMQDILIVWESDVTKLTDFKKKMFLLMSSLYLVGIKFPNKYGFLSLSETDKGKYDNPEKLQEIEDNLIKSITDLKYDGKIQSKILILFRWSKVSRSDIRILCIH